jgi:hypothetical protein
MRVGGIHRVSSDVSCRNHLSAIPRLLGTQCNGASSGGWRRASQATAAQDRHAPDETKLPPPDHGQAVKGINVGTHGDQASSSDDPSTQQHAGPPQPRSISASQANASQAGTRSMNAKSHPSIALYVTNSTAAC